MRRAVCTLHLCRPCLLARLSVSPRPSRPSVDGWVPGLVRLLSNFPQRSQLIDGNFKSPRSRDHSRPPQLVESTEKDPADIFGNLEKPQKPPRGFSRTSTGGGQEVRNLSSPNGGIPFRDAGKPFEEVAVAREDLEEDLFGTISDPDFQKLKEYEEEDLEDLPHFIPFKQKPWWYLLHMKKLIRKKRLPDALEFFEVRMRVEDRVRPLRTVYDMLIAACGRAGYVKKAFSLYVDMKSRSYDPVDATYVGLFNACAECPTAFQEDALRRARKLRDELHLKGHIPNQIVFHSMIKAFGRMGDLVTAFQLADEMVLNRICIDDATFAFLLMACISDKESGLRHAIKVWRLMLGTGATPGLYHYNLLLKTVRDCKLGDLNSAATELLSLPAKPTFSPDTSMTSQLLRQSQSEPTFQWNTLPSVQDVDESQSVTNQVYAFMANPKGQWSLTFERETRNRRSSKNSNLSSKPKDAQDQHRSVFSGLSDEQNSWKYSKESRMKTWFEELHVGDCDSAALGPVAPSVALTVPAGDASHMIPDLLAPLKPGQTSNVVSIREVHTPMERLNLFGGYLGILSRMNRDEVCPDEKFLTQLIEAIPPTRVAEEDLLRIAKKLRIKLGTDFYNILIKKRVLRRDSEGALEIFRLIQSKGLLLNEMTFGCLARGCHTIAAAEELLVEMQKHELVPNIKIFGSLCTNALFHKDIYYVFFLISQMKKFDVAPDEKMLSRLEEFRTNTRKAVLAMEKGQPVDPIYSSKSFRKAWDGFCLSYKSWLQKTSAPVEMHPWTIYGYRKPWPSLEKFKRERTDGLSRQTFV